MTDDRGLGMSLVVIGNVALVAPAGTVTLAGMFDALGSSLLSVTTVPPEGAADDSRTVPVADWPTATWVGLICTAVSVGADVEGGGVGEGDGEGVVLTEQPESDAVVAVAEPSFTLILQSAGLAKPERSILKFPPLSLVVMEVPLTVIGRLAAAVPSTRSCEPLSSARETRTVAEATGAVTAKTRRARAAMRGRSANTSAMFAGPVQPTIGRWS